MMLSYKIKGIDTFINIEDTYYGGSQNIIDETSSLGGFSKSESSGFFSLTDILIYELNKYSNSLGTIGKNNLTLEEYSNLLRNYIDSQAYRFLGFISVNAIKKFIERFSVIRRIKLQTYVNRNLVSLAIFKKFIIDALLKDHPIILQIGKNRNKDYPKYSIIVGIEDRKSVV